MHIFPLVPNQMLRKPSRLVRRRSSARAIAADRVALLERALGRQWPNRDALLHSELIYAIQSLAATSFYRVQERSLPFFIIPESVLTSVVGMGLVALLHDLTSWGIALAVLIAVGGLLSGFLTWRALRALRPDVRGGGDTYRMKGRRRALVFVGSGAGVYVLLFGILPLVAGGRADAEAALSSLVGVVLVSMSMWALLGVSLARMQHRARERVLALRIPAETFSHEIMSALLVSLSCNSNRVSLLAQRRLGLHLERACYALERGMLQNLHLGDHTTALWIAIQIRMLTEGVRDLKRWIAIPRPDTYKHLAACLDAMLVAAVERSWDLLPRSTPSAVPRSPILTGILVALVIVAGGLTVAAVSWAYSRLGLPAMPSAVSVPLVGAGVLMLVYFVSLIDPDFGSRLSVAKQLRDAASSASQKL